MGLNPSFSGIYSMIETASTNAEQNVYAES